MSEALAVLPDDTFIRYYRMRDYSNLDHAEILARVKEGVQRQK